eukprot:8957583-Pyramimonas_sp.AAC.2
MPRSGLRRLHWLPLRGYAFSSHVIGWPARASAGPSRLARGDPQTTALREGGFTFGNFLRVWR